MSLDFDELLDVDRLRAALAEARGRDVTIALLDTGVDVHHPDLQGVVVRSLEVSAQGGTPAVRETVTTGRPSAELDPVGHGTACAGILHEMAPEAKLVSVRVLGGGGGMGGSGEQFLRGLQWVLEQKPRIPVVNMSLGTTSDRYIVPLRRLVDQAYFEGTLLVAAGNNMGVTSYPAVFASLIAVDNESFADPFVYHYKTGQVIELAARGIYVRAPRAGGGYQLFTGTSFATPHVTALVARLLSINPRLTPFQVKTLLFALRHNRVPGAPAAGT
jgi:subtilisin family serine protease